MPLAPSLYKNRNDRAIESARKVFWKHAISGWLEPFSVKVCKLRLSAGNIKLHKKHTQKGTTTIWVGRFNIGRPRSFGFAVLMCHRYVRRGNHCMLEGLGSAYRFAHIFFIHCPRNSVFPRLSFHCFSFFLSGYLQGTRWLLHSQSWSQAVQLFMVTHNTPTQKKTLNPRAGASFKHVTFSQHSNVISLYRANASATFYFRLNLIPIALSIFS